MRLSHLSHHRQAQRAEGFHLSPREAQVLGLIWEGLSLKEMAVEMGVSTSMAKSARNALFRKMGVHRQVMAVRRALQLGILREPDERGRP